MNQDYEEQIQELRDEVKALKAQLKEKALIDQYRASTPVNYNIASQGLLKLGRDNLLGSGVIVTIHSLSGKELVEPICFKDGFSHRTVNSLLDDIQYSYDFTVSFKPTLTRLKQEK